MTLTREQLIERLKAFAKDHPGGLVDNALAVILAMQDEAKKPKPKNGGK